MPLPSPFAYLVTYDLKQTDAANYQKLFDELKRSELWWHYLTTTWIVKRRETLAELQTKIVPLIYTGDFMLIVPAKGPGAGWLPKDAWTWINNNVPREW